ncbi:hypothetical protein E2C01_101666 [Portunus trituberculatus]|uniref:Uncharacterized protein n=1 Tax=Portunus trituberculatus TaxID=210409 RepID=A0A5B7KMH2_PORTR|nr:hypothetical protein [Portunus trituberculatus]
MHNCSPYLPHYTGYTGATVSPGAVAVSWSALWCRCVCLRTRGLHCLHRLKKNWRKEILDVDILRKTTKIE